MHAAPVPSPVGLSLPVLQWLDAATAGVAIPSRSCLPQAVNLEGTQVRRDDQGHLIAFALI
jgi:hypothetical protein